MESSEQKKSDMVTELGSAKTGSIYTLTIIGQVEGHQVLPETAKTTMPEEMMENMMTKMLM